MAVPPNTTPETATVMTMPWFALVHVSEAPGGLHPVWFAYTAGHECEIGFWAFADLAGSYAPATTVYTGTPDSLTIPHLSLQNVVNRPIQVPVIEGQTYYFHIQASVSGAVTTLLQISLIAAPNVAAPVGSLAINDDTGGFPIVVFSATDGAMLQYRGGFPAGETVSMVASGISIWADRDADVLQLYSATLMHTLTPLWTTNGGDPPLTSNRTDTFYVADSGVAGTTARVTTISTAGALGPTTWILPVGSATLYAIAVSLDGAVLYYFEQGGTGTSEIKRWDLVGNTALSPLAASVPGYTSRDDLLVLLDDTVIVGYRSLTDPYDSFVRHYTPAGTLLHTYPLTGLLLNRLTVALDDPVSFWTCEPSPAAGRRPIPVPQSAGERRRDPDDLRYDAV